MEQETTRVQPRVKLGAELPALLTVPELAKECRAGTKPFYEAIQEGRLEHLRFGRSIRIPRHIALRVLREGIPPRKDAAEGR